MRIEIAVCLSDADDAGLLIELTTKVPEVRASLRRAEDGYVVEATGDRARYLMALMIERLYGTETYEQWLARNTGTNPRRELLRLSQRPPAELGCPKGLGE
jgi:hypothetical protein